MLEASAAAVMWDMGWAKAVMPFKSDMEIRETDGEKVQRQGKHLRLRAGV